MENDKWEEILAKERTAEVFYNEYLKLQLAAAALRMAYSNEYGTAPLINQFDQPS